MIRNALLPVFVAIAFLFVAGCSREDASVVVLYTSVDQPVAQPIVDAFTRETGIKVELRTDTEATKSVGLAERLRAEKASPKADVWWGNEVFHTINLANEGVLQPYASQSPSAADVGLQFRDPDGRWASVGLRARVIVVTQAVRPLRPWPEVKGLADLLDPNWRGQLAIARPTAGTTGGHVAALYVLLGQEKADAFFRALHAQQVKLLGGNSVVADHVARGTVWAGLTDNDDYAAALHEGGQLTSVLPDQDGFGTLTMPTTVGLVAGAPHASAGKKLVDYLLSPQVEQKLLDAKFARYSVRDGVGERVKTMPVDYRKVAEVMPTAVRRATALMEGRAVE